MCKPALALQCKPLMQEGRTRHLPESQRWAKEETLWDSSHTIKVWKQTRDEGGMPGRQTRCSRFSCFHMFQSIQSTWTIRCGRCRGMLLEIRLWPCYCIWKHAVPLCGVNSHSKAVFKEELDMVHTVLWSDQTQDTMKSSWKIYNTQPHVPQSCGWGTKLIHAKRIHVSIKKKSLKKTAV